MKLTAAFGARISAASPVMQKMRNFLSGGEGVSFEE
jgi:hypothetical protein